MRSALRNSIGGQSHLILPVVLASIALTGIGFAVAAMVGTGADAASSSTVSTFTIQSTISGSNVTVVHNKVKVVKHVVKGKVITRNGKSITLPASTSFQQITTPGKTTVETRVNNRTHTLTNTQTQTQTQTNTLTQTDTQTVTAPPVTVTPPTVTVTPPPVTVTVTSPPVTVTVPPT